MIRTRIISALLVLCLTAAFTAEAKEVNKTQALAVASIFSQTRLQRTATATEPVYTAVAASASLRTAGSRPLFYAYNLDGGGFVIVAADTHAHPVLAYSDEGSFSAEGMPASLNSWLRMYEQEISRAASADSEPEDAVLKEWETFGAGLNKTASAALLQTAIWDQNDPYNALCPKDGRNLTQTGCVATAMGIVMKYHQWPNRGQGSIRYSTKTNNISVSANFNAEYKWTDMLNTYNRSSGNSWTQAQADAVATLLFHCGAAVEMDYLTNGSGANEWSVVRAMTENFGYDKSLFLVYRELYSTAEWDSLMQREIDEGRPILYGGITGYSAEEDEGHQLVVDGYSVNAPARPNDPAKCFYHINWGWNGSNNGYFLLSALNPNSAHKGYNLEQDAIIGVRKEQSGAIRNEMFFYQSTANDTPDDPTGLFTDVDSIYQGKPFNIETSFVADYGMRDFEGTWGFFVVGASGYIKDTLEVVDYDLPGAYGVQLSSDAPYVISGKVEAGDCVRLYYRSKGHDWRMVRGLPGAMVEIPLGVKIGTAAEATVSPDKVIIAASNGNITVRTSSDYIREIEVYSISGQLIYHQRISGQTLNAAVPAQSFARGIYIVKTTTARGTFSGKIIL